MITARQNDWIKLTVRLLSSSKARREEGLFAAEGVRLCMDALKSGAEIRLLLFTARGKEKYPEEIRQLRQKAFRAEEVDGALFEKICDTQSPQGILCLLTLCPDTIGAVQKGKRYLGLENVQDPSNVGTILRTAEALGMDGVFLSGDCCDVWSPKVVRGSMGAVFRLPFADCGNMTDAVRRWTQAGIPVFASSPGGEALVGETDFSGGGVMLIGNEGNGLRRETIEAASLSLKIPMNGRAESLNAAAAAAILMYEMCT